MASGGSVGVGAGHRRWQTATRGRARRRAGRPGCTTTRRRCEGAGRNGTGRAVSPQTRVPACSFFVGLARPRSRRANGRPVLVTRTATRDATASGWASATQGRCTGGPRPPPRGVVYGVRARWVASRAAVPSAQRPTRGTSVGDPPFGHSLGTRPRTVRPALLPLPRPRAPSHSLSTGLWGARAVPLRIAAAAPAPKYHSTGDPGGALATRAVSPSPPSVPPSPVVTPPPDHCTSRTVGQAPHRACTPVSTATPTRAPPHMVHPTVVALCCTVQRLHSGLAATPAAARTGRTLRHRGTRGASPLSSGQWAPHTGMLSGRPTWRPARPPRGRQTGGAHPAGQTQRRKKKGRRDLFSVETAQRQPTQKWNSQWRPTQRSSSS